MPPKHRAISPGVIVSRCLTTEHFSQWLLGYQDKIYQKKERVTLLFQEF